MSPGRTSTCLRCVLDTNTVLALWMFEDPALAGLRAALDAGTCRPVSGAAQLEELRRVLAYPRFGLSADRQQALHAAYVQRCERVAPTAGAPAQLPLCRDPDDQKFLELAVQAGADLLVSRDKALLRLARHRVLRERLRILRPEALVAELAQGGSAT